MLLLDREPRVCAARVFHNACRACPCLFDAGFSTLYPARLTRISRPCGRIDSGPGGGYTGHSGSTPSFAARSGRVVEKVTPLRGLANAAAEHHAGRRNKITLQYTENPRAAGEGLCQIGCSARFYAGWDSMISTLSANHSASAGAASRQSNVAAAVEGRCARHSLHSECCIDVFFQRFPTRR